MHILNFIFFFFVHYFQKSQQSPPTTQDINTSPSVPGTSSIAADGGSNNDVNAGTVTGTTTSASLHSMLNPTSSITSTTATSATATAAASDSGLHLEATSTDRFELTLHRDAKFWDSVTSRKQRAKKRKARKFLSAQQERFSILDGSGGGGKSGGGGLFDDEEGATEVNFYSSFTNGADSSKSHGADGGSNALSGL